MKHTTGADEGYGEAGGGRWRAVVERGDCDWGVGDCVVKVFERNVLLVVGCYFS